MHALLKGRRGFLEGCIRGYLQGHARWQLRGFLLQVRGLLDGVDNWRADKVDHRGAILALLCQLSDIANLNHRHQLCWRRL